MILNHIFRQDFYKIKDCVFTEHYSRHPSGKRLGYINHCIGRYKVQCFLWDYRIGNWSDIPTVRSLKSINLEIPPFDRARTMNGRYLVGFNSYLDRLKSSRWTYGLNKDSLMNVLGVEGLLELYNINKKDDDLILDANISLSRPLYEEVQSLILYKSLFVIGFVTFSGGMLFPVIESNKLPKGYTKESILFLIKEKERTYA